MLSSTKSRYTEKRLLVLSVILFTVFFSYTVVAQESGLLRRGWEVLPSEKIQKLVPNPLPTNIYSINADGSLSFLDTLFVPTDYATIQAAINASVNGNLVIVEDGTYLENIDYIGKAITVASRFFLNANETHIENTTIDGSQPNHPDSGSVVFFQSGEDTNSVLYGFTITGGTGSFYETVARCGGGVFCNNSGAKIMHNIIESNFVTSNALLTVGGGIAAVPPNNSWIIVENNTIRNNSVTNTAADSYADGGGIFVLQNARVNYNIIEFNISKATLGTAWAGGVELQAVGLPLVLYCIGNKIWNNKALTPTGIYGDGGVGGGLSVAGGPKAEIRLNDIRYNEVEGNVSLNIDSWGAGVILHNQTSETIFSQNYVAFNRAINNCFCKGAGIAIWNYDISGGPQLINNIITDNTGGTWGGGLFIGGYVYNDPTLINNTICNNSATLGGAIYIGHHALYPSDPRIINSILWNNSSSIYKTTNSSDTVRYSNVQGGYIGEGNINADPLFSDTLYHLSDSSSCIGAGIESIQIAGTWYFSPVIDFEGNPRPNPAGSMPDIGASENPLAVPVVPVELTSFTATAQNNFVELNWTTATEINNQGFEVQRSFTNSEFVTIGFVEGNGTTTEEHRYSFKDKDVSGFLRYRLKQIDFDGSYEYSDIVEVEVLGNLSYELAQNYPNPFNPITNISYTLPAESQVKLSIYNTLGELVETLVNEKQDAGKYDAVWNAANHPSGVYIYTLDAVSLNGSEQTKISKKMILMK